MPRPRNTDRNTIRSERISLAMTPATYDAIACLAQIRGISVNEFVVKILDAIAEKNSKVVADFDAARKKAAEAITVDVDDTDEDDDGGD